MMSLPFKPGIRLAGSRLWTWKQRLFSKPHPILSPSGLLLLISLKIFACKFLLANAGIKLILAFMFLFCFFFNKYGDKRDRLNKRNKPVYYG
jgi:hypothetical protein